MVCSSAGLSIDANMNHGEARLSQGCLERFSVLCEVDGLCTVNTEAPAYLGDVVCVRRNKPGLKGRLVILDG